MSPQEGQTAERGTGDRSERQRERGETKTNKMNEWRNRLRNTEAERETESARRISGRGKPA